MPLTKFGRSVASAWGGNTLVHNKKMLKVRGFTQRYISHFISRNRIFQEIFLDFEKMFKNSKKFKIFLNQNFFLKNLKFLIF
jgi:hypothetical protein